MCAWGSVQLSDFSLHRDSFGGILDNRWKRLGRKVRYAEESLCMVNVPSGGSLAVVGNS